MINLLKSSVKLVGGVLGGTMAIAMIAQTTASTVSAQSACQNSISVTVPSTLWANKDGTYEHRGTCYHNVYCVGGKFTKGSSSRAIWCDRYSSKRKAINPTSSAASAKPSDNANCGSRLNVRLDTLVTNNFDGTYKVNGRCYNSVYCRGGKFIQGSVPRFIHCKPHSNHKPSIGNYGG